MKKLFLLPLAAMILLQMTNAQVNSYRNPISTERQVLAKSDIPDTYTIHAGFGGEWAFQPYGTISPLGDSTVTEGSNITYYFTPNAGYHVGSVTLGGVEKIQDVVDNTYTVSNIMQDDTLWVLFAIEKNNTITKDEILYWIGEGENEIILAVNWCEPETALAWGYKFDGESISVADVLNAIKEADHRFNYEGSGYLTDITYVDSTYTLIISPDWIMYNVNEEPIFLGIDEQLVYNGDIIEFGGYACALSDDFGNNVWTTTIVPVSNPNVGINSVSALEKFLQIYPNPAKEQTTLFMDGINGKTTIQIVDINGRVILKEQIEANGFLKKSISTEQFSSGIYVVHVQCSDFYMSKKLIVK